MFPNMGRRILPWDLGGERALQEKKQNGMQPRITVLAPKGLIGQRMKMSLANPRVGELWRSFRIGQGAIANALNRDWISLAVYPPGYFLDFDPSREFERWAAVEVNPMAGVPPGMEPFDLPGGLYAVFQHKGPHTDTSIFQFIFGTWIPQSPYALGDRPHFEVLGEEYSPMDPDSQEEIWIPITERPVPQNQ